MESIETGRVLEQADQGVTTITMNGELDNDLPKRVDKVGHGQEGENEAQHPLLAELQAERAAGAADKASEKTLAQTTDSGNKIEDQRVAAAEKAAEMTGPENLKAAVAALERVMKLASSLPSDMVGPAFSGAKLLSADEVSPEQVSRLLYNLKKFA